MDGANARIENYGTVITRGGFFDPDPDVDGDEFFSEGIFANGDGFRILNFGTVRAEGESASALVGTGANGVAINYGHLDSVAFNSSVLAVIGDGAQGVNAGLMTIGGADNAGMFVLGEGASGLNLGRIVIDGTGIIGMEGVFENAHMTNRGVITVRGDDSFGMAGFGNNQEVSNFGLIDTQGTLAIGMAARGGGPLGLPGLDSDILNAGRITTAGDIAFGIAMGVGRFGIIAARDDEIVNRGTIETHGDGAAGVVMIRDGHHLTNSGRITSDGGAFFSDAHGLLFHATGVAVSGDGAGGEHPFGCHPQPGRGFGRGRTERAGAGRPAGGGYVLATAQFRPDRGRRRRRSRRCRSGDRHQSRSYPGRCRSRWRCRHVRLRQGGTLVGDLLLGDGDDLVVVENGSGRSRVADFAAGAAGSDVIDVSDFFSSFGALISRSHQQGDNVVIMLDRDDRLVLENVQLSALNTNDFLFV